MTVAERVWKGPETLWALLVDIGELRPYSKNPRNGDLDAIEESLHKNGQYRPIVVRQGTNEILAGNHTYMAAMKLGWTHIAATYVVCTDEEAARIVLVDNRTNDLAKYDDGLLAALLQGVQSDLGLEGTGYTDEALAALLQRLHADDQPKAGIDDIPPAPRTPISKRGDMWQLGNHRVICGDATDRDAIRRLLNGSLIDLVFTSPPYNVGVDYKDYDDKTTTWDRYADLLKATIDAVLPKLDAGRCIGWNIGASPKIMAHRQVAMFEERGLTLYRQVIWKKTGVPIPSFFNTRNKPLARNWHPNFVYEFVYVFVKGELEHGEPVTFNELLRDDVFELSSGTAGNDMPHDPNGVPTGSAYQGGRASKAHPAMFPTALPTAFIQHLSDPGAIVFDPFAGAGTTLIAAETQGRRGYMVEISPQYVDVICRRFQAFAGVRPVNVATREEVDFSVEAEK